ncbi:MAG: AsmA family protein, partial [Rickettsiaceae bacterium]|nr:AsmA family protein [Rickettsiaceae bacterium]
MIEFLKYSGSLILILVLALLALPFLISLDHYQEDIKTKIKAETGRDLLIKDKISFSILPIPKIVLYKVELSSLPDEEKFPILKVGKAKATLAIFPLFTGKLVISNIVLENPEIHIEKLKKGKDHQILKTNDSNKNVGTNSPTIQIPKLPFTIKRLAIENGQVLYVQNKEKIVLENINLVINNLFGQGAMEFFIKSKIFDENVTLNGSIDANQSVMPIMAECKIKQEKATIEGEFRLDDLSFAGNIKYEGNVQHLSNFFPSMPQGLTPKFNFTTRINIDKENVLLSNLNFSLDKILAKGEGSYNFKNGVPTLNLNVMPGNIVMQVSNQALNGYKINLKAQSLRPILESLQINSLDFPLLLSNNISLVASASYNKNTLDIKNIALLLGEANLEGSISINWQPNLNFTYNLKTNKGSALMKLGGIKSPVVLSEVKIKGVSKEEAKIWHTDTHITLAGIDSHVIGKVDTVNSYKTSLTFVATGHNLGNSFQQLLNQKTASSALGAFSLSHTISGQLPVFEIALNKYDLTINNKKMSLNGKANIDLSHKPQVNLDLVTSEINLNGLSNQGNISNNGKESGGSQKSGSPWSQEKIDLSFLNEFDGIFTISIPRLIKAPLNIDAIKSKLQLAHGKLNLETFSAHICGGTIAASGQVVSKTGEVFLSTELKEARLKDAVPDYKEIKIAEGNFNLSSKLQSIGTSEFQYVNNLSGNINVVGTEGKINGVNLQKILDGLNNINDLSSIVSLLDTSFAGGQTAFNKLEANVIIKQGIGTITHFKLDAPEVE